MVHDRSHIETEKSNPDSAHLDEMPLLEAVKLMNQEDQRAVAAVSRQAVAIAQAVEMAAQAFRDGGRLIYVGAGTSGRLGILDAVECPPTFSSDLGMVVGILAGGAAAIQHSIENVEDDAEAGAQALRDIAVTNRDVVMGIAAGGTTPFVHGAIAEARQCGAKTIFLTCTLRAHVAAEDDVFICIDTGPEVLTGSTRLKAGTATKLVLNTISTLVPCSTRNYGWIGLKPARCQESAARTGFVKPLEPTRRRRWPVSGQPYGRGPRGRGLCRSSSTYVSIRNPPRFAPTTPWPSVNP